VLNKNFILARYFLTFREVYKYKGDLSEMKNLLEILTAIIGKHIEKWIFDLLSGTFRLGSRMFLVCFSFLLRSNLLPVGFQIALKQVRHLFARRYLCADSWFG
jgi:hypothetical protein